MLVHPDGPVIAAKAALLENFPLIWRALASQLLADVEV